MLNLRGDFHLEPGLSISDPSCDSNTPMNVFPITDEQAILVRNQWTTLIDLPSQEVRWTITCPALDAALDMERNILALGARGWVHLWDLASGLLVQTLPLGHDIPTALAFHPHGEILAVAPCGDGIQLWRLGDRQLVHRLISEDDDGGAYKSVAFSPDGQFLATGNFESGEVWLWHVSSGELVQRMEPSGGRVDGLAFSPDGQLLVCSEAGSGRDGTEMRAWNMHTREAAQSFLKKEWLPTFRPDGKLLASGDLHGITIWDVATRTKIRQFPAHTGRLARLTFSPSGRILISMGDRKRTVRWWDIENGQEIYRLS